MRKILVVLALLFAAGLVAAAPETPPRPGGKPATRATMQRIFSSMRVLLPLSVSSERFSSSDNRAKVLSALDELAKNAALLEEHTGGENPGAAFLGRSLAHDVVEIRRRYAHGETQSAARLFQATTQYCVACHARLPSTDSPLTRGFVEQTVLDALPPLEKAHVQLATRQFDGALETFENALEDRSIPPKKLLEPLADYLTCAIQVRHDLKRPQKTLARFSERTDLWNRLRGDIDAWSNDLGRLESDAHGHPSITAARRLLDEADDRIAFPNDRRPLVEQLVAASLLNRFLDEGKKRPGDRAEAYFLLALVNAHTGRRHFTGQTEAYLESAIRLAPGTPIAEEAYGLLEEELLLSFGQNGEDTPLPEDVERRLRELETLVETGRSGKRTTDKPAPVKRPPDKPAPLKRPFPKKAP